MLSKYQPGESTKRHLEEVEEICNLRHLYDMPCRGCVYDGLKDCPEVLSRVKAAKEQRIKLDGGN